MRFAPFLRGKTRERPAVFAEIRKAARDYGIRIR